MDVAASEFYDNKDKTYDLNFKEEVTINSHFFHMLVKRTTNIKFSKINDWFPMLQNNNGSEKISGEFEKHVQVICDRLPYCIYRRSI